MCIVNAHKKANLKELLSSWPSHTVATSIWLEKQGVSRFLRREYVKSGWIKPIGHGAAMRLNEKVDWPGAMWAIQNQLLLPIHIGGKSAISLQGRSHFLQFGQSKLTCFLPTHTTVPLWFIKGSWSSSLEIIKTNFIKSTDGLISHSVDGIEIQISSLERAILELIYLAPSKISFDEINLVFENMTTLRPDVIQKLLTACSNYRVIRLFLYLSDIHKHPWEKLLDRNKISTGSGVLQIEKGGYFSKKYQMTIPKDFLKKVDDEENIF